MTYARARLWLGICCVGTIVLVSLLALLLRIPARLLSTGTSGVGAEVGQLAAILFVYAVLSGPFDLIGGYVLPKEYGRTTVPFARFLGGWLRGGVFHGLILLAVALTLLHAARAGGFALFLGAFAALNVALLVLQPLLASLIGGVAIRRPDRLASLLPEASLRQGKGILLASATPPHFSGGVAGLPGRERILLPERWLKTFSPEQREAILLRRIGVVRDGSRTRGLLLAMGWNLAGACLAHALAGGVASVASLVAFALWFTLWNFVGLLALTTASQRGVFGADAFALRRGASAGTLREAMRRLDRDQDDEHARPRWAETFFHPIPSVQRREARLERGGAQRGGAWHAARMAVYLSWAGVGLLSRAVHCNCGRPEVWVFLPCD